MYDPSAYSTLSFLCIHTPRAPTLQPRQLKINAAVDAGSSGSYFEPLSRYCQLILVVVKSYVFFAVRT